MENKEKYYHLHDVLEKALIVAVDNDFISYKKSCKLITKIDKTIRKMYLK